MSLSLSAELAASNRTGGISIGIRLRIAVRGPWSSVLLSSEWANPADKNIGGAAESIMTALGGDYHTRRGKERPPEVKLE
jgi:hypothetical protein